MPRRALLQSLHGVRPALLVTPVVPALSLAARHSSTGPATIVDRGFWRSLVPKPLRKENRQALKSYGKRWNPATFFIVIFLLIGSMSIQMITLRNSFDRYMRVSQVRIGLLREVVERIQNGEEVDVEKLLGTGEPEKEADWEAVLRDFEKEERKAPKKEKEASSPPEQTESANSTRNDQEQHQPETIPAKKSSGLGSFF